MIDSYYPEEWRRAGFGMVLVVFLLIAGQDAAFADNWSRDDTCGTGTYDRYLYPAGRE